MSDDFKKAMDEAVNTNLNLTTYEYDAFDMQEAFERGADWAYEWCAGDLKLRVEQLKQLQAKADKLAEALRIVQFNMRLDKKMQDADWMDLVDQALKEYKGSEE